MIPADLIGLAERVLTWLASKYQQDVQKRQFDEVILWLHLLGERTGETVLLGELTRVGLSKMQILEAVEKGMERGYIADRGWKIERNAWGLTQRGILYAEALIEEGKSVGEAEAPPSR